MTTALEVRPSEHDLREVDEELALLPTRDTLGGWSCYRCHQVQYYCYLCYVSCWTLRWCYG